MHSKSLLVLNILRLQLQLSLMFTVTMVTGVILIYQKVSGEGTIYLVYQPEIVHAHIAHVHSAQW